MGYRDICDANRIRMINQTIYTLLIEDNPDDAHFLRQRLAKTSSVHFNWEIAGNLGIALAALRTKPFDLVLFVLSVPDRRAVDTFARLYQHAVCLPIVILTGRDDEALAIQLVKAGAQNYLIKGELESKVLVRALCYAIETKQRELALQKEIHRLQNALKDISGTKSRGTSSNSKIRKRTQPDMDVILVEGDRNYLFKTSEEESTNYRLTGTALIQLLRALRLAWQGNTSTLPAAESFETRESIQQPGEVNKFVQLSQREREVLRLIANGGTNREIARRLSVSLRTAERYRAALMHKLGFESRAQLIAYAVQQEIVNGKDG